MTIGELKVLLSNYRDDELIGVATAGVGRNVRAITGVGEQPILWMSELGGFQSKEGGTYAVILKKA